MLSLLFSIACSTPPTADPALDRTELNDQGATSYVEGTSSSSELYLQAQDAVMRGDLDAAHALYTELSRLEPASEAPLVGLASLALLEGDVDTAAESYTLAHTLAPTATQPMLGLGTVAMERGQHDDARDWYAKALAQRPELPDAHLGQLNACVQLDNAPCIVTHGQRLLELAPDSQYAGSVRALVQDVSAR